MFTLALKTLVRPDHHTKDQLLPALFLSREYEMIYEEVSTSLLSLSKSKIIISLSLLSNYNNDSTCGSITQLATLTSSVSQLLDYLLSQTPTAVAEVAELLEGLQKVAPQLFERLLEKAAPSLSPAEACETGDHAEVCFGIHGKKLEIGL